MTSTASPIFTAAAWICILIPLVSSHTVITYPGWRGDNLNTNGSVLPYDYDTKTIGTNGLGVGPGNDSYPQYPYGMQWMYPCGGMPTSTNRTKWPVHGGAVALQPGWFQGHATALIYINLGEGTYPKNMSLPMVPVFQLNGPSPHLYNGTFCLPQVPLPVNFTANIGDNATIQVVETAVHGAALYNCVDITFADPKDVAEVNADNCFNSSNLSFDSVFSTSSLTSSADYSISKATSWLASIPLAAVMLWSIF